MHKLLGRSLSILCECIRTNTVVFHLYGCILGNGDFAVQYLCRNIHYNAFALIIVMLLISSILDSDIILSLEHFGSS